uniref:G-protein coupled receptors family 1 profile domain-containing protein n=1 Tax=Strigamia maritima TaxID=126957 RepID=T1IP50_STRMM
MIGKNLHYLAPGSFANMTKLEKLLLSNNKLKTLEQGVFQGLDNVLELDLQNNLLQDFDLNVFMDLPKLKRLILNGNFLELREMMFPSLPYLNWFYFKKFHYCSYAPHVRICTPKTDGVSSLDNLLGRPILRLSVWLVGAFTCLGNTVVLWGRMISREENKILSLFIRNLAGMCFPLHIDDPFLLGWEYSAFIFLGLNGVGVLVISTVYTAMFISIKRTRQNTPLAIIDTEFAFRFFCIVFTDCVCWIPIIVIKIAALYSADISADFYAWVVVFILPINSALNPILYTFTTSKFRNRIKNFCWTHPKLKWIGHVQRKDSGITNLITSCLQFPIELSILFN